MNLEQAAHFNRLTPEMRSKIEERVKSFGKRVRYKFDIAKKNPDPSKFNGDTIYPNTYTLDPCVIELTDRDDKRNGESRSKKIALIDSLDEKGVPNRFKKIQVFARDKSILTLNLDKEDDIQKAMYLELHPKHKGGDYADNTKNQVFSRIDEQAAAKTARTERTERVKALNIAQAMSHKELIDFADAMTWDSAELEEVLRNKVEELADTDPIFFNDLVKGKQVEYQSIIQQGLNKGIIAFDPTDYKFLWAGNKQVITVLSPTGTQSENEKFAEFFQVGGKKAEETFKKLKALVETK